MRSNRLSLLILALSAASGCAPPAAPPDLAAPLETQVRRSPWSSPYASGEQLRSRHYRIYCTATNAQLVAVAPGFMEAAYENYLRLTSLPDRPADEPMPIYLLGTRKEWAALTLKVAGPQAGTYLKIEAGGYYRDGVCVFWDIGGLGTLAVASHEGLHQFLHRRLRHRLPMWLEEGLCVTAEGYETSGNTVTFTPGRNVSRFSDLRSAMVNGHWIPIDKLLSMDASDTVDKPARQAVGYYAQLWALVGLIRGHETYGPRLKQMLADAEAGRLDKAIDAPAQAAERFRLGGRSYNRAVSEALFRHYICDDLESFEREYSAFAGDLAGLQ